MADQPWSPHPRMMPARGDIAASHLAGKVAAERFVEGVAYEVAVAQAPLRREPRPDAALDTEALKGERVTIYDRNDEGWSWGQLANDDYVGWLPSEALRAAGAPPTHTVTALRTFAFPGPDIKLPPVETLSLGCRLRTVRNEGRFAVTGDNTFVPLCHLGDSDAREPDYVAVAERFAGTPYLWGGRTSLGIDCSGLVQVALAAAGVMWPRDSVMQEPLGAQLDPAIDNLRRGDLVFWAGHVAIVRDRNTLVHANAHHMAVSIEPIGEARARIARAEGRDITSLRRIRFPSQ